MNTKEIILTGEEALSALAALPKDGPFGNTLKTGLADSAIVSVSLTEAEVSPKAESHDNFNDLFLVQSGQEEFWVGGEISDRQETKPGEWRGQNLVGARKYQLKAGDIIVVPKGIPHRHGLGSAAFLVIKTR